MTKYSLFVRGNFLPGRRISSLIKTSFKPSERKKQKSIGPVISHGMPESVISIRRNRSSVYNLAINDPITVTLREGEGGSAFLRSPPFLFFSCQKFFQLRIIIFPGMSRQFPTPLLPPVHPHPASPSLHELGLVSHRFLGNPPPPSPYNRLSQRNSFRGFFPG